MTNLIYARNIVYKRILLSKYTVLCVPKKYNLLQNIKFDVNFFASVCVRFLDKQYMISWMMINPTTA